MLYLFYFLSTYILMCYYFILRPCCASKEIPTPGGRGNFLFTVAIRHCFARTRIVPGCGPSLLHAFKDKLPSLISAAMHLSFLTFSAFLSFLTFSAFNGPLFLNSIGTKEVALSTVFEETYDKNVTKDVIVDCHFILILKRLNYEIIF